MTLPIKTSSNFRLPKTILKSEINIDLLSSVLTPERILLFSYRGLKCDMEKEDKSWLFYHI